MKDIVSVYSLVNLDFPRLYFHHSFCPHLCSLSLTEAGCLGDRHKHKDEAEREFPRGLAILVMELSKLCRQVMLL